METPFFGGTYQSLSPNAADDRCINLYPEVMETKQGKRIGAFYSIPGQRLLLTLPNNGAGAVNGPVRGVRTLSLPNLLLVVYGNQVVTVSINNVVTFLGLLNTASGPVSLIDNGTQYAVFDGYQGFSYSSGTWAQIQNIPLFPTSATIQDGFGLVTIAGTDQFYQSNLNDLTTWDPLNFSSADSEPSPCAGIVSLFRQVWVFKQNTAEIWNNAGLNGFAFQRMQGAYVQTGALAPYSITKSLDHVFWLGKSPEGALSVYMNNGYSEQRISTHPVEYAILGYMVATQQGAVDAIGFSYNQAGHMFYVLTFPGGDATWVYDLTTQLWHERGEYLNGVYHRWDPSCYAFFNGQHLVGSSTAQQLSVLDMAYPTDDLASLPTINPKRPLRRWRALKNPANVPVRYESLWIDMQTGANLLPPSKSGRVMTLSGTMPGGEVGGSVSTTYVAASGVAPYTYSVSSGSLPPGITLNTTTGVASGTFTTLGTYPFTILATDAVGNTATDPQSVVVTVPMLAGKWVLMYTGGANNTDLWWSRDLSTWTYQGINTPLTIGFYGAGWDGSALAVAGNPVANDVAVLANQVLTGPLTVSVIALSNNGLKAKAVGGILFTGLPTANNLNIPYSTTHGVSWASGTGLAPMQDIARLNTGRWVSAQNYGGTQLVCYSDQATPTTWTSGTISVVGSMQFTVECDGITAMTLDNSNGVYISTDGATWSRSAVYPFTFSGAATVLKAVGTGIFIGSDNQNGGVCRTVDSGAHWTHIVMPGGGSSMILRNVSVHGNTVVANFSNNPSGTPNSYVSYDQGATWAGLTTPSNAMAAGSTPTLLYTG